MDEEEIDSETLQAQIDLSMSFVQNLVAGWVKPRNQPSNKRKSSSLEEELKEYMRRPPRLGVGAPIPETHTMSRESARLKGKLLGSGQKQTAEEEAKAEKAASDDEQESRAVAIKKKVSVDPFGGVHGKKKKKKGNEANDASSIVTTPSSHGNLDRTPKELSMDTQDGTRENLSDHKRLSQTTTKSQKNPHTNINNDAMDVDVQSQPAAAADSSLGTNASGKSTPVQARNSKLSPAVNHRRNLSPSLILQQPLLNLRASPSDGEGEEETVPNTPLGSPKKKRKRRKKKKRQSGGPGDTLPQ